MRKLKLQMQQTIDGFVCGPQGELDWMTWDWDDAIKKFVTDLTNTTDLHVMGRKMAEGFIPYWQNVVANPDDQQYPFGKIMVDTPKIVFSKTLSSGHPSSAGWQNTTVTGNGLAETIAGLKKESGKDIIVYGGASFVSSLVELNLIDELYLFINPSSLGAGQRIFKGKGSFKLKHAHSFDCGIVAEILQPIKK